MTEAGERLIHAMEEALAIARGAQAAGSIHANGYRYLPAHEVLELVAKAQALVALLDDREVNHGSLIGPETLNAKNELRLELSRWK